MISPPHPQILSLHQARKRYHLFPKLLLLCFFFCFLFEPCLLLLSRVLTWRFFLFPSRGTPNSGTTSLSAISTTAIKDGHQGNRHAHTRHGHRSSSASDTSTTTLDAERADRISRLAGLERVATARSSNSPGTPSANPQGSLSVAGFTHHQPAGYFDTAQVQLLKERSTVGSASATASVGGRTTWASGSDVFDPDPDDGISSVGGLSDEGSSSVVGFGEAASSTISGPVSGAGPRTSSGRPNAGEYSPSTNRPNNTFPPHLQPYASGQGMFIPPSSPSPAGSNTPEPPLSVGDSTDARMVDGVTFDADIVDTTVRSPRSVGSQAQPETRRGSGKMS